MREDYARKVGCSYDVRRHGDSRSFSANDKYYVVMSTFEIAENHSQGYRPALTIAWAMLQSYASSCQREKCFQTIITTSTSCVAGGGRAAQGVALLQEKDV